MALIQGFRAVGSGCRAVQLRGPYPGSRYNKVCSSTVGRGGGGGYTKAYMYTRMFYMQCTYHELYLQGILGCVTYNLILKLPPNVAIEKKPDPKGPRIQIIGFLGPK